ncbi:MAG TPA: hypothetical protein VIC62_21010, partial [Nakamurella sp.]
MTAIGPGSTPRGRRPAGGSGHRAGNTPAPRSIDQVVAPVDHLATTVARSSVTDAVPGSWCR